MALAEKTGLHLTFVSSVERGERNLSLLSLLLLYDGLEVNPAALLEGLHSSKVQSLSRSSNLIFHDHWENHFFLDLDGYMVHIWGRIRFKRSARASF